MEGKSMGHIDVVIIDYGNTLSSASYFHAVPPTCPEWPQFIDKVFFSKDSLLFDDWMTGSLTAREVAEHLATLLPLPSGEIELHLRRGCRGLALNPAVVKFTQLQRRLGRKTALVTCNIDLFTEIVVPDQNLNSLFDLIVNSSDHKDLRKEVLWPLAFQRLGCDYANAFALDDAPTNIERFTARGGQAHRYTNDADLQSWLRSNAPAAQILQEAASR